MFPRDHLPDECRQRLGRRGSAPPVSDSCLGKSRANPNPVRGRERGGLFTKPSPSDGATRLVPVMSYAFRREPNRTSECTRDWQGRKEHDFCHYCSICVHPGAANPIDWSALARSTGTERQAPNGSRVTKRSTVSCARVFTTPGACTGLPGRSMLKQLTSYIAMGVL